MTIISRRLDQALNIADLRMEARKRLAGGVYAYLERGVEDDVCLDENRAALGRIKLLPRVLRDVSRIDINSRLLGREASAPIAIAPTGGNGLLWYRGDVALARGAAAAGLPFTISTTSTVDVEDIASAGGRLWYQLYLWENRSLSHGRWIVPGRPDATPCSSRSTCRSVQTGSSCAERVSVRRSASVAAMRSTLSFARTRPCG